MQLYVKESQGRNSSPGTQMTGTPLFPSMGLPPETAESTSQQSSRPLTIFSEVSLTCEVLKVKHTLSLSLLDIYIQRPYLQKKGVFSVWPEM